MSNDQISFDKFIEDWEASGPSVKVDIIPKKSFYRPDDGHQMLNELDRYMPPEDQALGAAGEISPPHTIWDVLERNGIDRRVVEHISLEFNNITNVIETAVVVLIGGDEVVYADVQLVE